MVFILHVTYTFLIYTYYYLANLLELIWYAYFALLELIWHVYFILLLIMYTSMCLRTICSQFFRVSSTAIHCANQLSDQCISQGL